MIYGPTQIQPNSKVACKENWKIRKKYEFSACGSDLHI
uniref:Uncharacterized protein n=1 Tax=Ascaris lumbricoides TaxID=6252 RepID=A0A0M3HKZ2_ASCLU